MTRYQDEDGYRVLDHGATKTVGNITYYKTMSGHTFELPNDQEPVFDDKQKTWRWQYAIRPSDVKDLMGTIATIGGANKA
jgi:hypothetical protein